MFEHNAVFSSYSVNNVDAALEFYKSTLGLDVMKTIEGLGISWPSGHSVFIYPKEDHLPATFTVLNFKVDDIDAAVERLQSEGIPLELYDNDAMTTDPNGIFRGKEIGQGPNIAWFRDPAGNILSVTEE